MTVDELIQEVHHSGATLSAEPPHLVVAPAGKLSPELKLLLKEKKVEILGRLGLEASMRRLEAADIRIAVIISEIDAGWHVTGLEIRNDAEAAEAIRNGAVIYTARDMYAYIQLDSHERHILRNIKSRFPGNAEWRHSA